MGSAVEDSANQKPLKNMADLTTGSHEGMQAVSQKLRGGRRHHLSWVVLSTHTLRDASQTGGALAAQIAVDGLPHGQANPVVISAARVGHGMHTAADDRQQHLSFHAAAGAMRVQQPTARALPTH